MLPPTEQIGTHNSCLEKSVSNEYSFIELHHEWINKYTDVLSFLRSFYILYTYHWILLSSQDLLSYAQSEIKAKNIYQCGFKRIFTKILFHYLPWKLYLSIFFFFLIDAKKIILFVESYVELRITKHRFEIVYIESSYDLISIIHRVLN